MALIEVKNLSFYYEGSYDYVFENVNFRIDTQWKLGLVGRNGRGKTTLLKLLMGKMACQGEIITNAVFDYFPFEVKDKSRNTEEVLEALDPSCEFWKICRELNLIGVDAEVLFRPFETLSHGEQTKVLLALLFAKENHFLLIDEPTNHLDMEARTAVSQYLSRKKGFILVSHDQYFLDSCVDYILAINRNSIDVERGNFSVWWMNRQRKDAHEQAENERLQKDIRRLKSAAGQAGKWADDVESTKIGKKSGMNEKHKGDSRAYIGEKSRRMQQRRKNLERRQQQEIEEKENLLQDLETVEDLTVKPLAHHKKYLAELENLEIYYGEKKVCGPLDIRIEQGKRIALAGRNGSGKSSILKLILGETLSWRGNFSMPSDLKISYVPQDTSELRGSLASLIQAGNIDKTLFLTILRKMDFSRELFEKPMESYSSGQKKKVLLAGSLSESAHLYIWDEPLNYIDIFSRMQLEAFIKKVQPTMLIVEHDRKFVENVVNSVISVDDEY